jgi:hypothetical protein
MVRTHATPNNLVRRLRLSPESLTAAAALHDPGPLLQLEAERSPRARPGRGAPNPGGRPTSRPASPGAAP